VISDISQHSLEIHNEGATLFPAKLLRNRNLVEILFIYFFKRKLKLYPMEQWSTNIKREDNNQLKVTLITKNIYILNKDTGISHSEGI